jgi:hypothetical protein
MYTIAVRPECHTYLKVSKEDTQNKYRLKKKLFYSSEKSLVIDEPRSSKC